MRKISRKIKKNKRKKNWNKKIMLEQRNKLNKNLNKINQYLTNKEVK